MAPQPVVLVAEDFLEFRARIVELLDPLDVTCHAVSNGRLAIEFLRDTDRDLGLLVTDMDMPVHTGWEVIEAARAARGVALPIIMQTGEARYTYVRKRADDYGIVLIDKDDVASLLVPAVRDALGLRSDQA